MKKNKLWHIIFTVLLFGLLLVCDPQTEEIASTAHAVDAQAINTFEYSRSGIKEHAIPPFRLRTGKGDEGKLTATLPDNLRNGDVLCLFTSKQNLSIRVEGECIYSWRPHAYPENAYSLLHYIPLEEAYGGKELEISVENLYVRLPNTFEAVYLGSFQDVLNELWRDTAVVTVLEVMTFLLGLISVVLSIYYNKSPLVAQSIRMTGLFLLAISTWSLIQIPIVNLIPCPRLLLRLEQLSLLSVPILVVLAIRPLEKPLKFKWEYNSFCVLFFSYFALSIALDIVGFLVLPELSVWSVLFFAIFLVYIFVFGVLESSLDSVFSQRQRALDSSLLISVMLCALLFCCTLISFSYCTTRMVVHFLCGILLFTIAFLLFWEMRVLLRIQNELAQSQMTLLLSQIKPHFLYNTLNSIRTLIRTDAKTADDLVYNFSHFLRNNMLSINSKELIPFQQELEHIISYVRIEETCFPKLKVVFDIRVHNFAVPPLTIQPLVENAIKHGVLKKAAGGTVRLSTWEAEDGYCVEIQDDGVGFSVNQVLDTARGNGLENVTMRLKYSCNADLKIDSQIGEGCMAFVKIPKRKRGWPKNADNSG